MLSFLKRFSLFRKRGTCCVHTDSVGNSYYSAVVNGREKRWVVYAKKADPSSVPAECHVWLHYTSDVILPARKNKVHIPNLTGTECAYHPHKIAASKKMTHV